MTQPKRRKPREWWLISFSDGVDFAVEPGCRWADTAEVLDAYWTKPTNIIKVREVPKPAARKGRKR